MKKILQRVCYLIAVVALPSVAFAQLSGSYTINAASPTSGTNYQSFADAVTALSTNGVNGAVTFNVVAGTYTEQISIPAIAGASTTNTILFKGLGSSTTITAVPTTVNRPVISLDSASHITLDNLKIEVTGTIGWGVHFMNHADTNSVINCEFVGPATSGVYGIIGSGAISTISVVQNNGEYLTIANNSFTGFDRAIQFVGKTGPLTTPSKKVNYGTDIIVKNNQFTGFAGKAVIINHYHNIEITENVMSTTVSSSNGAISSWDAGDNVIVTKNDIYVSSNANNTRLIVLAMAPGNGPAGDTTKPGLIANNMMIYDGNNSTSPTGIYLKNKSHIEIYHNTVRLNSNTSSGRCLWLDANNSRALHGIAVRNNIFYLENSTGYFIYNNVNGGSFKNMLLDHNNYYNPTGYFRINVPNGTNGTYSETSFSDYLTNTYGYATGAVYTDPKFISPTDLHATSGVMSDLATPLALVTDDIDGDMRSTTTPDIGADEYLPPSCISSTGLGAFNVLATEATLFWTSLNTGNSFKVQYGAAGFTLGSGTNVISANDTLILTGLTAQTDYEYFVLDVCSATDSSVWSGPFAFTTTCGVITSFPHSENFDGSAWTSGSGSNNSGDVFDPCWMATPDNSSSGNYRWGPRSGSTTSSGTGPSADVSGSGNYMYVESSYGSAGSVAELLSPMFDLSQLTVPQLEFQYHMYGTGMGTMNVAIRGNGTEDTLFTQSTNNNAWVEMILSLAGYSGNYQIVFYAERASSISGDMAIDEFIISETPPCPSPVLISMSNATPTSADINFTSTGTKFIIEYGPSGFAQGTGLYDTASATGHTIMGLNGNTAYDFYIRNDCTDSANGFSTWEGPYTISTTCSVFTVFPYTETFDGIEWTPGSGSYSTGDGISTCWSRSPSASTAYRWAVRTGSTTSSNTGPSADVSGSGNYIFTEASRGSNGHVATMTSPEFDLSQLTSAQLVFDYHMYGAHINALYVEISNGTMADTVASLSGAQGNQWNNIIVNLDPSYSGIYHFNIYGVRGTSFGGDMAIDQFIVKEAPACIAPTHLSANAIYADSLAINWGGGDGSSWEIEYGQAGFTQGTGMTQTGLTDSSTTLTGLLANTCYDVYVRSNCNPTMSAWFGPVTICTSCNIAMAPFAENFDNAPWINGTTSQADNDAIDDCWSRTPNASGNFMWRVRSGSTASNSTGPSGDVSGSGNYMYTEASSGSNNDVAYLELPMVDFTALTQPTLMFDYHMYGVSTGELFVTIYNGTQWDTIYTISGAQQSGSGSAYITEFVDLTAYKSVPRQIRIAGKRGSGLYGDMAIDEVKIEEMPTCLPPANFAVSNITATTADFSWTSITNGTNYIIEYGITGFSQGTGAANKVYPTGTSGNITGLTVNTTYDAYLADQCDSTVWVGPITFTTLIDYDASLTAIVSPQNLTCGDSNYVVEVSVENLGQQPITSLPVGVNVTGAVTASINTTYTTTIAPGATANIAVGTINSYMGGNIHVEAFTNLGNDQLTSNDTINVFNIEVISAVPLHMPVDTVCASDSTGMFVAIPQTGISHNWYANANDNTPYHVGDTLTVPTSGQTTWYLDRNKDNTLEVQTGTQGSAYGTMFKFYAKQDYQFTGYTFVSHLSGSKSIKAFYKIGTYKGSETSRANWTLIDSLELASTSSFQTIRFDFATPLVINAGDTVSIYLASKTGKYESEGLAGATIDSVFKTTDDFEYIAGVSGAYFGSNLTTASSSTSITCDLHWSSLNVCGNNRIPLTLGVNNDTAVASFTSNVNANGADVDFDASASSGHIYDWDFGDGNSGTGMMTMHTYAVGNSYPVTLTVTDTVCGTVDSITMNVLATVGLEDNLLSNSLQLFPNPNNGNFRVEFEMEGVKNVKLTVLNTVGQVVNVTELGRCAGKVQQNLSLENVAEGMYFLRVESDGTSATIKFNVH